VNQKKAEADLAYDLQKFKTASWSSGRGAGQHRGESRSRSSCNKQEIMRKQRELEAMVQKPRTTERYRVETLANARKFQLETEAAGAASATKATGFAGADVVKATGLAEADA